MAFIEVEVGNEIIEFPDTMSDKDIKSVLQKKYKPIDLNIKKAREFEQSIPGKIVGLPGALLNQRTPSDMLERRQELKSLPLGQRLKETALDVGRDVARAAPMLVGGPAVRGGTQLAKGVLARLTQLGKQGAGIGAVTGASKSAEEMLEGAEIQDALATGGKAGLASGAMNVAVPAVSEGLTSVASGLAKSAMKIKPWALKVAEKEPDILKGNEPKVYELSLKVKNNLDDYADKIQKSYDSKISKLNYPKGDVIETTKVAESIKELNVPKDVLQKTLVREANRQFEDIPGSTINKFLNGQNLSFAEAKNINSFLSKTVRSQATEQLGTGGIAKIKNIKSRLMTSMENPVVDGSKKLYKPIRTINKNYAKRLDKFKALDKNFANEQVGEGRLRQVGEELAGVSRNKTALTKKLKELDRVAGKENAVSDQLVKSTAADEFEKRFETARLGQLLTAGTGAYIGNKIEPDSNLGFIGGGLAGASLGQKAPLRFLTRGIGAADRLGNTLRGVPTAVGRVSGAATARQFSSTERTPAGNYSPSYQNEIINERFRRTR